MNHIKVRVKMLQHVPGDNHCRQTHAAIIGRSAGLAVGETPQPEDAGCCGVKNAGDDTTYSAREVSTDELNVGAISVGRPSYPFTVVDIVVAQADAVVAPLDQVRARVQAQRRRLRSGRIDREADRYGAECSAQSR